VLPAMSPPQMRIFSFAMVFWLLRTYRSQRRMGDDGPRSA
jgi:hypothetical protein